MDEAFKKQAAEWFERGQRDLETARLILEHNGHPDSAALHIHQAVEKYFKGFLAMRGKKPPRIHELDTLLNIVLVLDDEMPDVLEFCEKASGYYIESRYPPGPSHRYNPENIKNDLVIAETICNLILKKYKKY